MNPIFDAYAAYYDLLYQGKDYTGEASYVLELLAEQGLTTGSILELGCGTGKHSTAFAHAGFDVEGIDLSQQMIDRAIQLNGGSTPNAIFSVGDARTLRTGKKYDAVLALFHVASYQTSNRDISQMFDTAAAHLDEGGIFIFDYWHGPGVLTDLPEIRKKVLEDATCEIVRIATPTMHPSKNVVDVDYHIEARRKGESRVDSAAERHSMRYFFEPELEVLLELSGLCKIGTFEFLTKSAPSLKTWQAITISSLLKRDSTQHT
ncbi:hypothetical protein N800_03650 [Lysobacter daejeonensis GH1-9]|uniref:Methyltransferase domain-containing protein n=1 Tax=Lysobacter daejeonensis GH1-9 TaxID=1385517 RepID=A0A0A0EUT7_9GAMM|nr:class I SAM-dependent methyltransferase [Lysobacter daejeonensis]KGM53858.1 hypothetical protein N800_03650 [Lysobacter daejeonensis GH1-9]